MTIACSRSSSAVTAKATSRGALSRRSSGKAIAAGSRRCGVSRFSSPVCVRRLQYGIEYANSFTTRICTRAKICCASARVKFRFEPSRLYRECLGSDLGDRRHDAGSESADAFRVKGFEFRRRFGHRPVSSVRLASLDVRQRRKLDYHQRRQQRCGPDPCVGNRPYQANPKSGTPSNTSAERLIDPGALAGKHPGPVLGDVHAIFQADSELAIDGDHRFVAEAHSGTQERPVAAD